MRVLAQAVEAEQRPGTEDRDDSKDERRSCRPESPRRDQPEHERPEEDLRDHGEHDRRSDHKTPIAVAPGEGGAECDQPTQRPGRYGSRSGEGPERGAVAAPVTYAEQTKRHQGG